MLFNSILFVLFFAVVYGVYVVLRHRAQNYWLLAASYLFYGWWDWRFLLLIFLTTAIDFVCSRAIYDTNDPARKKTFVTISVCANLGILGFFKYFNFFAENTIATLALFGLEPSVVLLHVILPVGISFYTFQSMSYSIDVYRGHLKPTRNFFDYALFVSFFPQLVAGPIERAVHLLPQVEQPRNIDYSHVREGAWLILLGFFKKVVVADNMAVIANEVFNNPGEHHGLAVLVGVYAFALQIYGDFSGYSDIARGTAKLMGFDLMHNFRMPYFATNPQEFWRRWHISLSTWLRDYLYISLGGSRFSAWLTYRNLFLTMLLGGLWHGAAWNFVLWGVFHGTLLIAHRLLVLALPPGKDGPAKHLVKLFVFFHITCVGWVLFRINAIGDLPLLGSSLLQPAAASLDWVLPMLFYAWPLLLVDFAQQRAGDMLAVKRWPAPARAALYGLLFGYILLCGRVGANEFIYFQF
jgi:D-alanyl-lipoteichoic acid acyltransferase DltB (MBOAT superfamily)